MRRFFQLFTLVICGITPAFSVEEAGDLFSDLALVAQVDKEIQDDLPFFYNDSLVGGYFNMPSARMAKSGNIAIGGGRVPPYNVYGVNFQVLDHVELSANYRVYNGILEGNFGKEGFGDDAERIGNFKFALLLPEDGFSMLPSVAVGENDFLGTKRFNAKYIVATKTWLKANLELSLGYGKGRFKGFFGGGAWSPFRKSSLPILKNLAFIAEYDAINYKQHAHEHPDGRSVKSHINLGFSYLGWKTFQLTVNSVRGEKIAANASLRYPLGTTEGFFPKVDNPLIYRSPVDTEPFGVLRSEQEFAQQLAYGFSDQGLDLYTVKLSYTEERKKVLWLKVINNRYRIETIVRDRIAHLLASLVPADVDRVDVVIEADATPLQSYRFRQQDLEKYRQGIVDDFEMRTLAPMREVIRPPGIYDSTLLFQRSKKIWTFTIRPRLLTFFGSAKGKFKYNFGIVAAPEGYLFDEVYYRLQVAYQIKSSMFNISDTDRLNPSQLPNVRSDTIRYYQSLHASLEQAYLQKGWNLGKGCFWRLAAGYFEPAYGGIAAEMLYYPVQSNWAVGISEATVLKRRYHGVAFTRKIRKLDGTKPTYIPFVGVQYFLDVYYNFKLLDLEFRTTFGQFLAKDKGVRFEVSRYFPSGLKFSLWLTLTNGHDVVNRKTYYDKGFAFFLPLDLFLKQSSRSYMSYAMSAWLRDVGAIAETGRTLYRTITEERRY